MCSLTELDLEEERQRCLQLFQGSTTKKEDLKSKFLELAKQFHPDNGGDEGSFQYLQRCYELLSPKLKPKSEPEWLRKLREDYATSKDPFP